MILPHADIAGRLVRTIALALVATAAGGLPAVGADAPPTGHRTDHPAPTAPRAEVTDRPDIVVLMLDDMAADVTRRLLQRTSTMRSLFVERGTWFPNAFGEDPVCCPGRAGFLTGLRTQHHGVVENDGRLFDPRVTIATALDAVGYHTIAVGKYFNDVEVLDDKTPPGWDGIAMISGAYQSYLMWRQGVRIHHGKEPSDYSTDVFAEVTRGFLRSAPWDQPRFLFLTPFATHGDHYAGSRLPRPAKRHRGDERCRDIGYRRTPAWNEADVSDRGSFVRRLKDLRHLDEYREQGWPLRRACESLLSVDEWLARVVRIQERQGRLDRTLFILTADNGMSWGDHRHHGKSVAWATPIPLAWHWPALLGSAPAVNPAFVQLIDLAPTIADLTGVALGPFEGGPTRPDGRSLLATLEAGRPVNLRRVSLYEERISPSLARFRWDALRTTDAHPCGLWHYTEWRNGDRELFDLEADPWELENVVGRYPELAREFQLELAALRDGRRGDVATCTGEG